jgi:hypothetical protein
MRHSPKAKNLRVEPQPHEASEFEELDRNEELLYKPDVEETLAKIYEDIVINLDAHQRRIDNNIDNWDMYNVKMGANQFYNGTNNIYVPLVRDALEARKTRFTNQLFPKSGRYVDCISQDGTRPAALLSLLNWYVRKAHIRTNIVPALIKAGDIEGQYSIYISWVKNERHVVWKETKEGPLPGVELEEIHEETTVHQYPSVEVIPDADLLILPAASGGIEDALSQGGCVVVLRRWTKAKVKQLLEDGELDHEAGTGLLESLGQTDENPQRKDPSKIHLDVAGIKKDGRGTYALVYEIWTKLLIDGKKRLCRAYTAGQNRGLSVRRNPYWSDKIPILSVPKDKVSNTAKGRAPCDAVRDFQIAANDAVNMGMDSAAYALMPIVMTDPEKNPHVGSMILTMAAVWKTSPNDTKFAEFPQLWKDAFEIVLNARNQIFQTLSVNPAQITQQTQSPRRKQNQAEVAQEQQVDLLTTSDAVEVLEEGILSPMLERFIELDHQFRDEDLTVPAFGEMGEEARMERIKPIQFGRRYFFQWFGVQAARNAQALQQQIGFVNVIMRIPPQYYKGYEVDLVPVLTQAIEGAFGPEIAPRVFKDVRRQLGMDPEKENKMFTEGLWAPVHPLDNHQQHMQVHQQYIQQTQDPSGNARAHMMMHQVMMMGAHQQQQNPQPGSPQSNYGKNPGGAQGAGPKAGASGNQVGGQRMAQQPAGAVHQDQMPMAFPRKAM